MNWIYHTFHRFVKKLNENGGECSSEISGSHGAKNPEDSHLQEYSNSTDLAL
jgi:hypothetical protein